MVMVLGLFKKNLRLNLLFIVKSIVIQWYCLIIPSKENLDSKFFPHLLELKKKKRKKRLILHVDMFGMQTKIHPFSTYVLIIKHFSFTDATFSINNNYIFILYTKRHLKKYSSNMRTYNILQPIFLISTRE